MIILGIDPGTVNLGLALYDSLAGVFLRAENVSLKKLSNDEWNKRESIRSLYSVLLQWTMDLLKTKQYIDMVVVESQWFPQLVVIEGAALMWGYQNCLTWNVHVVHPRTMKKFMGLKCNKKHYQNKKDGVRKVESLGYGVHNHNIADAMMLCIYGSKLKWNLLEDTRPVPDFKLLLDQKL